MGVGGIVWGRRPPAAGGGPVPGGGQRPKGAGRRPKRKFIKHKPTPQEKQKPVKLLPGEKIQVYSRAGSPS
jgi:hypothetical protein